MPDDGGVTRIISREFRVNVGDDHSATVGHTLNVVDLKAHQNHRGGISEAADGPGGVHGDPGHGTVGAAEEI